MTQTTNTVLMVRPVNFTFNKQTAANNSFQQTGFTGRAQEKALEEFDNYVRMLQEAGIRVIVAEDTPEPHTPDSIFPNNWFSTHAPQGNIGPEGGNHPEKTTPVRTGTEPAEKAVKDPIREPAGESAVYTPQPCGTLVLYPMFAPNRREERNKNVLTALGFDKAEISGSTREKQGALEAVENNREIIRTVVREDENAENILQAFSRDKEISKESTPVLACKEEDTDEIIRTVPGKGENTPGIVGTVSQQINDGEKRCNGTPERKDGKGYNANPELKDENECKNGGPALKNGYQSDNYMVPYRLLDLTGFEQEGKFLEGTGSMILDRENKIAYCCASPRTHQQVLDEFARLSGYEYFLFEARDPAGTPIYHTNVMMCIGTRYAIVCLDAVRDLGQRERLIELLEENEKEILEITPEQMNRFAGNMLELQDRKGNPVLIMSAAAYDSLETEQLERLQSYYKIVAPPLDYIEKNGGGSARCMLAEVF